MARLADVSYRPDPARKRVYDELFAEYRVLHDYFGRGENDVMKRLKAIRGRVAAGAGPPAGWAAARYPSAGDRDVGGGQRSQHRPGRGRGNDHGRRAGGLGHRQVPRFRK